jgi:hypothetical protein
VRRVLLVLAVLGLLGLPGPVAHASGCGRLDRPETGIQGDVPRADQLSGRAMQGYNCGIALVGHTSLGDRGGNANMAWAGTCAYVAGAGNGIAVVDVSDPANPRQVTTLHGDGSDFTLETIAAREVGDRAVLVAGRYGLLPTPVAAPVDIYDVRDCTHPKLVTTYSFPANVHNLTISPDGNRIWSTLPVQAVDITDLAHPTYLGNLDEQIPMPFPALKQGKELAHEAWTSPDGNTLYLGGQTPMYSWFTIVDVTGWPARPPKVLSQTQGRGHSIRLATIDGRRYLLHSEESVADPLAKGCLPEQLNPVAGRSTPWLSDVTDPTHPKLRVGTFELDINRPEHCLDEVASQVNASVHYHDVDDPADTTFAMASMWNAGLRVIDVRRPTKPTEVAYFNPGAFRSDTGGVTLDKAWGHVRYVPETGHIWFATETGGFWVVELEPQVRAALRLPAVPASHPDGGPARPASTLGIVASSAPTTQQYYCTLGALLAPTY